MALGPDLHGIAVGSELRSQFGTKPAEQVGVTYALRQSSRQVKINCGYNGQSTPAAAVVRSGRSGEYFKKLFL